MSLFKVEKTVGKYNFISLIRNLTLDDVDVQEVSDANSHTRYDACIGLSLTLKTDIINELIQLSGIKQRSSGSFLKPFALSKLTAQWKPNEPAAFLAIAREPISYRGKGTGQQKRDHLTDICERVKLKWDNEKNALIAEQLTEIKAEIQKVIDINTANIHSVLRNLVVEQNIKNTWFDENLSDADKSIISTNDSAIENYQSKIYEIEQAIKAKQNHSDHIKRSAIERAIINDPAYGEQTKAVLAELSDEEKEPIFDFDIS